MTRSLKHDPPRCFLSFIAFANQRALHLDVELDRTIRPYVSGRAPSFACDLSSPVGRLKHSFP